MGRIQLVEFCGEEAANSFLRRADLQAQMNALDEEKEALEEELRKSFSAQLTLTDVLVATVAGVVCGAANGVFKTVVPKHGPLKHKHSTTRTAVDYKVPKPAGMKGSVQGLHRQIGPGHDLGRFNEALDLMSGKTKDFPLWGKTIAEQTGGVLHPGNMEIADFLKTGGFHIPKDPKAELMNHLLIDFFTKTSLPLPFSSYIADHSQTMAKLMTGMYDKGLNLKTVTGNATSIALLQLITHSYAFLFKSASAVDFYKRMQDVESARALGALIRELNKEYKRYLKSKEFQMLQAIAHGSSFLLDTVITMASKNYAGLLSLDYGALLLFAANIIKYTKQSLSQRKETLSKIAKVDQRVLDLECSWYDSYRQDIQTLAQKEEFQDAFDPERIKAKHDEIERKFEENNARRSEMLQELQDWNLEDGAV